MLSQRATAAPRSPRCRARPEQRPIAAAQYGVTILGESVSVGDEVTVSGCTVLPHKELKETVREETIL